MIDFVPPAIVFEIEAHASVTVKQFSFCGGGCINTGGKLLTSGGIFFLKWNGLERLPRLFETEADGLRLLRSSNSVFVPEVIHVGVAGTWQFLLMPFISEGPRRTTYWSEFGTELAALHRVDARTFGLDYDNYIGTLVQCNTQLLSWTEFFVERRLRPQLRMASDDGKVDSAMSKKFETLFNKISSLVPEERPSLLHGDLWGGNLMTTPDGRPCLIDPAVYYGNREVDIAMTHLFGGFDFSYMKSYEEVHPLLPGFHERLALYNLYPLLVHVNLFGGGYASQVKVVLNRFV
jgi:protein-ribulosamine 3-kinase